VRNQPASAHAQGLALALDLLWLGVVYGLVDGLLLSVLPVLATWQALSLLGWIEHWPGRIAAGIVALAASLFVTAVYHLGYPEFRGPQIISPHDRCRHHEPGLPGERQPAGGSDQPYRDAHCGGAPGGR
jgi:hypothetical protein